MAEGKDRRLWNYTCSVIAKLHNAWWSESITPEQIHPYSEKSAEPEIRYDRKGTQDYLRAQFGRGNGR